MNSDNPFLAPESDGIVASERTDMGDVQYAGFWLRFVAAILDGIFTFLIGLPVGIVIGLMAASGDNPNVIILGHVADVVIGWLYMACFECSNMQGSPGKRILGLKVVDESGAKISFGRATGRHFAKIISTLILMIGYMMAGWTKRKQGLHDILAGCLVIKAK